MDILKKEICQIIEGILSNDNITRKAAEENSKKLINKEFFLSSSINLIKTNSMDNKYKLLLLNLIKEYISQKIINSKFLMSKIEVEEDKVIKINEIYNISISLIDLYFINNNNIEVINSINSNLNLLICQVQFNLNSEIIFNASKKVFDFMKLNSNLVVDKNEKFSLYYLLVFNILIDCFNSKEYIDTIIYEIENLYELILENYIKPILISNNLDLISMKIFNNILEDLSKYIKEINWEYYDYHFIFRSKILNFINIILNLNIDNNLVSWTNKYFNLMKLKCLKINNILIKYYKKISKKLDISILDENKKIICIENIRSIFQIILKMINNTEFQDLNNEFNSNESNFDNLMKSCIINLINFMWNKEFNLFFDENFKCEIIFEKVLFYLIKIGSEEISYLNNNEYKYIELNMDFSKDNSFSHYKVTTFKFIQKLSTLINGFSYDLVNNILHDLTLLIKEENNIELFKFKNIKKSNENIIIIDTYLTILNMLKLFIVKNNEFHNDIKILLNLKENFLSSKIKLIKYKFLIFFYYFMILDDSIEDQKISLIFNLLNQNDKLLSYIVIKIFNNLLKSPKYFDKSFELIKNNLQIFINNLNNNHELQFQLMKVIFKYLEQIFFKEDKNDINIKIMLKYITDNIQMWLKSSDEKLINSSSCRINLIKYLDYLIELVKHNNINKLLNFEILDFLFRLLERKCNYFKEIKSYIISIIKNFLKKNLNYENLNIYIEFILNDINIYNIDICFISSLIYYKKDLLSFNIVNSLLYKIMHSFCSIETEVLNNPISQNNSFSKSDEIDYKRDEFLNLMIILIPNYSENIVESNINTLLNYLMNQLVDINLKDYLNNIKWGVIKYDSYDKIINCINITFKFFREKTIQYLNEYKMFNKYVSINTSFQVIFYSDFDLKLYFLTIFNLLDYLYNNNLIENFLIILQNITIILIFTITFEIKNYNFIKESNIINNLNNYCNFLKDNCNSFHWIYIEKMKSQDEEETENKSNNISFFIDVIVMQKEMNSYDLKLRLLDECYLELYINKIRYYELKNKDIFNQFGIVNNINIADEIKNWLYYKKIYLNKYEQYRKIIKIKK